MEKSEKKILLVDDDKDFRRATRKILESDGYQVIEAENSVEGLEKAESEAPDLIIIDVIMDSYTEGFNMIQRLAENAKIKDIPRIILSTLGIKQDLDMIAPEELKTEFILQKTVKKEELIKTIESAFERRKK
ncbi:MAG: response regulator [Deltaproteobacteria bacterium]|uniref:Response regulator n=1 Tax=Candidatus Zymogenus saltonus TaxID=2844893 RepID=A0A9D8KEZ6_9DELT|nr:response regulator [Candidatus Zymogenus saltonus]